MNEKTNKADKEQIHKDRPWLFKPGESGNPAGMKPGTRHLSTLLKEALKERAKSLQGDDSKKTWQELLINKIIEKAVVKGDFKFAELIMDRLEGKAPQTIDLNAEVRDSSLTDVEKKALLGLLK